MLSIYRKIHAIFNPRERKLFFVLMVAMVFVAFAELIGLSAVFVLLGLISEPENVTDASFLGWVYNALGFASIRSFQIAMAFAVLLIVILSLVVKAAGLYAIIYFAAMRGFSLSARLIVSYMRQPYAWFLTKNSSDISHRTLTEVERTTSLVIIPGLKLLSNAILAIAVICFLIVVDPIVSLLSAALLCVGYGLVYFSLRGQLRMAGEEITAQGAARYRLVNEIAGGFREVKIQGLEDHYEARYKTAAYRFALAVSRMQLMGQLPRFALEGLAFGILLMLIFILLLKNDGNFLTAIPTLGIFAYAVLRLLPALQQIYHGFTSLRSNHASLDLIHRDLMEAETTLAQTRDRTFKDTSAAKQVTKSLDLEKISFKYSSSDKPILNEVSISIPAKSTIGLVGGTGAGKTTLVDILLGLLAAESGEVRADGEPITQENMHAWQRAVGYVPQTIYLTDDTMAANIAFGVPVDDIDMDAVKRAARLAALHDYVEQELPEGYDTVVGERGVRLSGGQRQRIGIARALYNEPSVLVLDEATSALDNITERVVMEAIASLRDNKTIILIAHRLTTVKDCDNIFLMEKGKVIAEGRYDQLIESNERFREMAHGRDT